MSRLTPLFLFVLSATVFSFSDNTGPKLTGKNPPLKPLVTGLTRPVSTAVGHDGRVFVLQQDTAKEKGAGGVFVVNNGEVKPFASGMESPRGIVAWQKMLFVADKSSVWRIDANGKATVLAEAKAFPAQLTGLNDIEADAMGNLYVSDNGSKESGGSIYRINPKGKVTKITDYAKDKRVGWPSGLRLISEYHLNFLDSASQSLLQLRLSDGEVTKLVDGLGNVFGLTYDYFGRIYVSDRDGGSIRVIPRPGEKPILLASGFKKPSDLCLARDGKSILVPDYEAGTVTAVPTIVPGQEIDERPLPVSIVPAFPDLEWTRWEGVTEKGTLNPHRPIVLTHPGDGSGRVVVATQHGVLHTFPNDQAAKKTKVFLDLQDRVKYNDRSNEEGFLGLAFHPKYKSNGEFFVFYTPKKENNINVVSRFKVSKTDPDRADPVSEERLLTFKKPFWNHDGGTVVFGPDDYLYVTHGDGGFANDPQENGQNLTSLLGKVLRIDVDKKDPGLNYSIPKDNPFVGRKDARPEIWAYGFRNIWRMAFDPKTGKLWAGDVGQNLWEEIDIVEKGRNYGWNPREGLHPFGVFGRKSVGPNKDMIDPIWEYHHDIGKSITGGLVYRGKRAPDLEGSYLYADYVSNRVWALRYDEGKKRVTANHEIVNRIAQGVFSFGEDDKGEAYMLTGTPTGKGLFTFAPSK